MLFGPTICSFLADPLMRFRWVALPLAELGKCSNRYEIDKQLADLPEGLDEMYNRILKNIEVQAESLKPPVYNAWVSPFGAVKLYLREQNGRQCNEVPN